MITERARPTPADVAKRIRVQLERHNLTVPKAAAACDMSVPSLETYLYGKSLPGALAISNLAHGLRCSADWLLFGTASA